jgi:hypothetical protein
MHEARVVIFNADMVSGLMVTFEYGPIPWLDEVGGRW